MLWSIFFLIAFIGWMRMAEERELWWPTVDEWGLMMIMFTLVKIYNVLLLATLNTFRVFYSGPRVLK